MKKTVLFSSLLLFPLILTGCFENFGGGDGEEYEGGGERISVVTDICESESGEIQEWHEGGDRQDVCYYPDGSFCYLEDLSVENCKMGDMYYYDDDLYPYAEQACIDSNGQLSETEDGEEICIVDEDYCYIDEIMDGVCDILKYDVNDVISDHEGEKAYQEYVEECYSEEQEPVCGEDGIQYYNRCFMEKAGVKEETELAEIVDGKCIYG